MRKKRRVLEALEEKFLIVQLTHHIHNMDRIFLEKWQRLMRVQIELTKFILIQRSSFF